MSSSPPQNKWSVKASCGAINTSNPIREIIESMDLAENPEKKVIPLSIGDPTIFGNLKPCKEILDALQKAQASGKYYGYQMAAGMEASREAVAEYHYRCTGNKVKRQDVILASGCSHAIDLCICVLVSQGQNILIPRPGFPLYKTLTSVYGIKYKQYNLLADKGWSVDLKHLESLIDANTAALVINNPSNPCGSVFSRKHLLQILELAEKWRLPIIADEIYDKFVFAPELYKKQIGHQRMALAESDAANSMKSNPHHYSNHHNHHNHHQQHHNNHHYNNHHHQTQTPRTEQLMAINEFETVDGMQDEDDPEMIMDGNRSMTGYVPFTSLSSLSDSVPILTCGGISKTCLIPGLRLGWIIINDRKNIFDVSVRNGLQRLTQRLMGPNSLVQGALPDILAKVPESFYSRTMDFIFKNAKLCYDRLRLVRGLQPHMPQGSMYLMVRFEPESFPDIDGDLDFTSKLMNEESVLVLPGRCFDFPNYFRICLTVPTNVMEEALDRMGEFCKRHYVSISNINSSMVNAVTEVEGVDSVADVDIDSSNGHIIAWSQAAFAEQQART